MATSVFELFKIGIGPSSSHTVGPMRAALTFASALRGCGLLEGTQAIRIEFFGSLGATGKGHGSDRAVLMGLEGEAPDTIDPAVIAGRLAQIRAQQAITVLGIHRIAFNEARDLVFHRRRSLPFHPNGMTFTGLGESGDVRLAKTYYSVGGGFVVNDEGDGAIGIKEEGTRLPYPFRTGADLLALSRQHGLSFSALMMANERTWRSEADVRAGLLHIWDVMQACVKRGCEQEGVLSGGMKLKRRARELHQKLSNAPEAAAHDPLTALDWVNLYALAVNEENAAGGRVVTAPTNGAAGIIPAVLHYYTRFIPGANADGVVRFLLCAAAIGILYKENASISGAEVGCQGEVGVACSMAAAALTEAVGGTPAQVENAAEIGMEHNLGLTCDPVGGLVQVPCIERNAMGSIKAINASRLALRGDGTHFVSLDQVIATMRQTGADMNLKYKETSRGGLAVNIIEC